MMMYQLEQDQEQVLQGEIYSIQQPTYANQPLQIRVNGLTLSTGNLFQAYLIRLMYPEIATPIVDEEAFAPTYYIDVAARDLVLALRRGDSREIRVLLTEYYARVSETQNPQYESQFAIADSPPPPPPPGDDDDDLAKRIADEIATVYYLNLEITLDDVIAAICKFIPEQSKLDSLPGDFADQIVSVWIDHNRMQLRALLPDKNIVDVALRQLQGKFFGVSSIVSFIKDIWNKFITLFTGSDDAHRAVSPVSFETYRNEISRTLDKYISWWKMSWFGHHHNDRANAVKDVINAAESVEEIRHILLQQKNIMGQVTDESVTIPDDLSWQSVRWNSFFEIRNRPCDPKTSGYCQVVEEALSIRTPT